MSDGAPLAAGARRGTRLSLAGRTLLVAVAALAVVAAAGALLSLLVGPVIAPPPPRNPFGVGLREGGGAATGLTGWILAVQADFYRRLTAAVRASTEGSGGAALLIGLSFLYGVFHAAGPGHGKAVISAWIVANERALGRGILLACAAAAIQALVAIALVGTLSVALRVTAITMTRVTAAVETASFAAVVLVGAYLLWMKARRLAATLWPALAGPVHAHAPGEACGPGCGHLHMPAPDVARAPWRSAIGAVLAAGMRPCTGAIIVLVFALSQGVFATGIAATFAMAVGTALLTGGLAALSVFFKQAALRLASASGSDGGVAGPALETLAAAVVLVFGVALLSGLTTMGG
nr:nickel/cobalt transporter [uncultured Alsobacter sp.]